MHKKSESFLLLMEIIVISKKKKEVQASMVSAQCSASINTSLAIQLPACWQIWCHLLHSPSGCNGISALRPALGPQSLSRSPSPPQIDCQNYHLLRGGFQHKQNGQEIRRPSSQVRQLKTGEREKELHRWQKPVSRVWFCSNCLTLCVCDHKNGWQTCRLPYCISD